MRKLRKLKKIKLRNQASMMKKNFRMILDQMMRKMMKIISLITMIEICMSQSWMQ